MVDLGDFLGEAGGGARGAATVAWTLTARIPLSPTTSTKSTKSTTARRRDSAVPTFPARRRRVAGYNVVYRPSECPQHQRVRHLHTISPDIELKSHSIWLFFAPLLGLPDLRP